MTIYHPKKDTGIFRFAIPFLKDAIERNNIFTTIHELKNKYNFSDWKLIHIASTSIECLLKSIILLSFYNYSNDWKIKKWLQWKKQHHNLKSMLDKVESKYAIWLNAEQKELIKVRWKKWISYRYWTDAFFDLIKTTWINSDKAKKQGKDKIDKDLSNYNIIYNELFKLCKNIIEEEYVDIPFELILKSTIQIPDSQFKIMKNLYYQQPKKKSD